MNGVGRVRGAPSFAFERSSVLALGAKLMKFSGPTLLLAFFIPVGP